MERDEWLRAAWKVMVAEQVEAERPNLDEWRALQVWLAGGERRVTIPYAKELGSSQFYSPGAALCEQGAEPWLRLCVVSER